MNAKKSGRAPAKAPPKKPIHLKSKEKTAKVEKPAKPAAPVAKAPMTKTPAPKAPAAPEKPALSDAEAEELANLFAAADAEDKKR